MKFRQNKKRIDPRYFLNEREELQQGDNSKEATPKPTAKKAAPRGG
jgi:hypothetical protein